MMRQSCKRVGAFFLSLLLVISSVVVLGPAKKIQAMQVWFSGDYTLEHTLPTRLEVNGTIPNNESVTVQGENAEYLYASLVYGVEVEEGKGVKFGDKYWTGAKQEVGSSSDIKFEAGKHYGYFLVLSTVKSGATVTEDDKTISIKNTRMIVNGKSLETSTGDTGEYTHELAGIIDLGTLSADGTLSGGMQDTSGGSSGGSSGESAQPATPDTPDTPEVSGRDGAVDASTLKDAYSDKTPATDSAANDAGLNATQVVDLLAGSDAAAKEELVEKAVAKGHLTLNVKTIDSKKITAKVDVPATLLSALTAKEMMDGLLGLDNITIDLEVKVTNATDVSKAVSNAVEAKKATGEELFYFDADMFLTKNGTEKEALTEFGSNKIDITVDIPEAIRGANRVFRLIRTHKDAKTGNLEVDVLEDQDKDANTFTLSTNKLCTLAFAYKSADLKSPKTGADELPFAMVLISFAAVAFVVGAKKYQR